MDILNPPPNDSLSHFNFESNELSDIPQSINNLRNLTYLNLKYNKLEKLPDTIGDLKYLQKLYFYGTHIKTLPETITKLINLKYIYLNGYPKDQRTLSIPINNWLDNLLEKHCVIEYI